MIEKETINGVCDIVCQRCCFPILDFQLRPLLHLGLSHKSSKALVFAASGDARNSRVTIELITAPYKYMKRLLGVFRQ